MAERDAGWAVQQYKAVRALLPASYMPTHSEPAANLGDIARHFDVFLLDAFGVLNVGNTAIAGAPARVRQLQEIGKRVMVLTNRATFPAEQALRKFTHLGFDFGLRDIVSSRDALTLHCKTSRMPAFWGSCLLRTPKRRRLAFRFTALDLTGPFSRTSAGLCCCPRQIGLKDNRN